ncbi:MAG TPA: hypothetical protein PK141_00230 [Polyangiaceae bacterium]|nr:hypothetical protein [Polyangiaceae bacterium]
MDFRTRNKQFGPRWLVDDDDESTRIQYSLDLVLDAAMQRTYLGMLARYPDTAALLGIEGALEAIGRDRRTLRGLGPESATSYATRLKRWLHDAKKRGSPFMLMQKLQEYIAAGSSFRTVDARGNWFSRSATGVETYTLNTGNWNWDSTVPSSPQWARFWVIIYPGTRWTSTDTWGSGQLWGDQDNTWGTTATPSEVAGVRGIVADWKPAGTRCVNIIIAFDAASFNPASPEPDGQWGKPHKVVAGVHVPSRLTTARYWDGTRT